MNSKHLLLTLVVLTSFAALAQAASQNQPQAAKQDPCRCTRHAAA
jgi:hypothetical protein